MTAPGLQTTFGSAIGVDLMKQVREQGFTIGRIDCDVPGTNTSLGDEGIKVLQQEALDANVQPVMTIRRPSALRVIAGTGALAEFGNEPDLDGWPTPDSYWTSCKEFMRLCLELEVRGYVSAISNLNDRGFDFLKRIDWKTIDPRVCVSFHRYPETGKGPTAPHDGFASREAEMNELRRIVGNRPLALTEFGYHQGAKNGYTTAQVEEYVVWEKKFADQQGVDFAIAFQIHDGLAGDTSQDSNYGFRNRDGSWKPRARIFTGSATPPPVVEPPPVVTPPSTAPLKGRAVGFSIGGQFLCAEAGGGREVVANRPALGPWETWTINILDNSHVSIQASTGHYLCAEPNGTVVANRTKLGEWERWTVLLRDQGRVSFQSAHGKFLCAEGGGGGLVVANRPAAGPWESFTPSNMDWWQTTPVCKRPLVGPLRIQDKLFRDDTGYRRVFFCSWFTALRILRDNPTEFERQLDVITDAGYQGFRTFFTVGGWSTYWDGREVVSDSFQKWFHSQATGLHRPAALGAILPAWSDYEDLLRRLLRACKARKLRLHQAVGDMQIIFPDRAGKSRELEFTRRVARICKEEGGLEVMALVGDTNEYPQNRWGSDSPESIEQMGSIVRIWKDEIPGVLTTMGSAISEEPDQLYASIKYGDVCAVHTSRGVPTALKRTHALVHWEGHYRQFTTPFWQGEPMGFGPEVSVDRFHRPCDAVALYAMHALTGQASNLFCGPAIHSKRPLEAEWGFYILPALFAHYMPEDIATWPWASNNQGGIAYWFKDKRFITAAADDWNTDPPRPVATWTLHQGDSTDTGTGTPPRKAGMITGTFS